MKAKCIVLSIATFFNWIDTVYLCSSTKFRVMKSFFPWFNGKASQTYQLRFVLVYLMGVHYFFKYVIGFMDF